MFPSQEAQYDEFGRPLHPVAKQIHNQAYIAPNPYTEANAPAVLQRNMPAPSPEIQQAPPTEIEQTIKSLPAPVRSDPAYKNSKLRTVLNAIAGGLAGAAGGPEAGLKVGEHLRDAKYNRANEDYKSKLGGLLTSSEVEKGQFGRSEKASTLTTQRIGAENKAESAAELNRIREENAQTSRLKEGDYSKNIESLTEQRKAREKEVEELTKKQKMQNDAIQKSIETGDLSHIKPFYNPSTKETPEEAAAKATAVQSAKDKQAVTPEGRAANTVRNVGRIAATGAPEALKAEEAAAGARTKGTEEAKTTPEMIERQAQLTRSKSLATLTANVKDVTHKAQIALEAFPDIMKQVDSAGDALFSNRWKEFRTGTLGTEDSEKYAALRANVGLLQTLVSQIHTGNRGVSRILDKFTNLFNVDKMNKKTFQDSINEVHKWIQRYSKLPPISGGYDLKDVDNLIESPASGKYGVIQVK